jgi:hypothetical protein
MKRMRFAIAGIYVPVKQRPQKRVDGNEGKAPTPLTSRISATQAADSKSDRVRLPAPSGMDSSFLDRLIQANVCRRDRPPQPLRWPARRRRSARLSARRAEPPVHPLGWRRKGMFQRDDHAVVARVPARPPPLIFSPAGKQLNCSCLVETSPQCSPGSLSQPALSEVPTAQRSRRKHGRMRRVRIGRPKSVGCGLCPGRPSCEVDAAGSGLDRLPLPFQHTTGWLEI